MFAASLAPLFVLASSLADSDASSFPEESVDEESPAPEVSSVEALSSADDESLAGAESSVVEASAGDEESPVDALSPLSEESSVL